MVHLWAGSPEFPGAATLTSLGALRSGAGYVRLFSDRSLTPALATSLPELLLHPLNSNEAPPIQEFLQGASALIVGPGLPPPQLCIRF